MVCIGIYLDDSPENQAVQNSDRILSSECRVNLNWKLVSGDVQEGPINMALDEIGARRVSEGTARILRVYLWRPSTLSLGYSQGKDTVNWNYCNSETISVTRRPTGGGGIYHDRHDDVSYSIIVPKSELPGDLMESYHLLCEPILDAFSKVGIDVQYTEEERDALYQPGCYLRELHPAHDMVTPDGRKIAGNAQYRQKDVVVQHGSLSYAVSPEKHLACFTGHDVTPEEYRERVTGVSELVDVSREEFVTAVEEALMEWCDAEVGSWTHEELAAAEELAEKKYRAESWVRHGEDPT